MMQLLPVQLIQSSPDVTRGQSRMPQPRGSATGFETAEPFEVTMSKATASRTSDAERKVVTERPGRGDVSSGTDRRARAERAASAESGEASAEADGGGKAVAESTDAASEDAGSAEAHANGNDASVNDAAPKGTVSSQAKSVEPTPVDPAGAESVSGAQAESPGTTGAAAKGATPIASSPAEFSGSQTQAGAPQATDGGQGESANQGQGTQAVGEGSQTVLKSGSSIQSDKASATATSGAAGIAQQSDQAGKSRSGRIGSNTQADPSATPTAVVSEQPPTEGQSQQNSQSHSQSQSESQSQMSRGDGLNVSAASSSNSKGASSSASFTVEPGAASQAATVSPAVAPATAAATTPGGAAATMPTTDASGSPSMPGAPQGQEVDQLNGARVSRGLHNAVQQGGGSMTLRLTPAEMGTVRIQMQLQGATVSAQFHTETESARSMLHQQITQLRQALEGQGLSVERLTVQTMPTSSGSMAQHHGGQQQGQSPTEQSPQDGRSRGFTGHDQQRGGDGQREQRQDREFENYFYSQVA